MHLKKAGLTSCDILNTKDNLEINLKDEFIRFHEWKTNFKEWDFGSDSTVSLQNFKVMKAIWLGNNGYVGKKICENYEILYHDRGLYRAGIQRGGPGDQRLDEPAQGARDLAPFSGMHLLQRILYPVFPPDGGRHHS